MRPSRSCRFVIAVIALPLAVAASSPPAGANPAARDLACGPGLRIEAGDRSILLPLVETRVRGELAGFVARVRVTQVFVNPYDDFIEATYVFPLSERAAVNGMVMRLGDRDVVAKIELREEAERIYDEAVSAGRTAALLEQQRANVFTQKVGNIAPGEKIEVDLTYVEALRYDEGISSFAFPTVVGPRYIPGLPLEGPDSEPSGRVHDTSRVPDASEITPPSFDEGEPGVHRIDLELELRPGVPIRSVDSPSHEIEVTRSRRDRAVVRNAPGDRVPNKDFVLEIDLRGKRPEAAVLAHRREGEDGYVTVAIQPPALPAADEIAAKDLFFVVDNSGSMSGAPLAAAKALVKEALAEMNPNDRFTIMRFSDSVSALSPVPLANTPANVAAGARFVDRMSGMGGTEMLSGIRRALEGRPEPGRLRVVFFLTDGYIGNDDEILAAVRDENDAGARLFSLGVGSSVNRYLLSGMARLGRGEMQVMRFDEEVQPFVERFYRRVRNPVLTDVDLEWRGLSVSDQTPELVPDLFDGSPLLVHARYERPGSGELVVSGLLGDEPWSAAVPVELPARAERPAVSQLWARAMISIWSDEEVSRPGSRRDEIATVALSHDLVSKYTSFVAVDRELRREPSEPLIPVAQRIPLPEGVSRNALGALSRYEIPPGDPYIEVWAPSDARRVVAIFPFGLIKDLAYDELRDLWRGRFLVPAGIPDGYYPVLVSIQTADGSSELRREVYHLDSSAAEFELGFERIRVRAGRGLPIEVDAIEPAAEVYVHCPELGWERLALQPSDERGVDWERWLRVAEDALLGEHSVLVVVRDAAGNRLEREVTVVVYGGEER